MADVQPVLSPADIQHFIEHGYVIVPACFTAVVAQELTDRAFIRLGYDRNDSSTWLSPRIHMPAIETFDVRNFSPKAWSAMCELLGGEERVQKPCYWSDAFIANFHEGADEPWRPPSAACPGWHKDGDFFRHYLDSPEQGLLTLVIWKDIQHMGGGTFIAPDSIKIISQYLADRPEGVLPNGFPFKEMIGECNEFVEFTGKVGDVVLLHPYMLHAVSQNHSGIARFITNPPVGLLEPMQFNRTNADDFSPVERVVLHALNLNRLDYRPTGSRERIVPDRVIRQRVAIEEEKKRLFDAGVNVN